MKTASKSQDVQLTNFDKGLDILTAFKREKPALTALEIGEITGLKKSTLYRFLRVLLRRGFLRKKDNLYMPGLKLLELGDIAGASLEVKAIAKPFMVELANQTGMTSKLSIYDDGEVVCIENIIPKDVKVVSMYSGRAPCHCTSTGKMLLSGQPQSELERVLARGLIRYTSRTITDGESFKQEIEAVRLRGYAVDNEEWELGLRGVAGPIYDARGDMVASLCLTAPVSRLDDVSVPKAIELVKTACREISFELGYRSS